MYFYAASLYPGGSQADINAVGFDWMHNYWCNLMNDQAMNGLENPARPFAISGLVILCSSLALFFMQFARQLVESKTWKLIIQVLGTLSMISALLIFTEYHDLMTIVSSLFGLLVVVGIIRTIYKTDLTIFKIGGMVGIVLLGINNLIYYSEHFLEYLPLIQKITFALVLAWVVGLNVQLQQMRYST